jgi:hypothetical protein
MVSFKNLDKTQIKAIVIQYNLKHHIPFSRVIDGKRHTLSKKKLIIELEKHLYIDEATRMIKHKNESLFQMPLEEAKKEHKKLVKVLEKAEKKVSDKAVKEEIKVEKEEQKAEMKAMKAPKVKKISKKASPKAKESKKYTMKDLMPLKMPAIQKIASDNGIPLEITVNKKKQTLKRNSLIGLILEKLGEPKKKEEKNESETDEE